MSVLEDFKQSLLPGNYALTKSMELTKSTYCGTLWYTKKFLTLYYYVFLSNEITTISYKDKIRTSFELYVNSLDDSVKDEANSFFFPDNPTINVKSDQFILFTEFAGYTKFNSNEERDAYIRNAKKLYFAILMGSGGQTGVKKLLKEYIQQPGFVYSKANIEKCILDAAIKTCVTEINNNKKISDNSVKYIISDQAVKHLIDIAQHQKISATDVLQAINDFPHSNPNFRMIESDLPAFIRNERQLLYYYGFFHSKSSGANDFEFSSLTPVGELALMANASEFLAIWEHQKLKMISQPATAEINNLSNIKCNFDQFGISYSPYTDILGSLLRRGSFSIDEYKYIIARKKHSIPEEDWIKEENAIFDDLQNIKQIVNNYKRAMDIRDEDARKELLKYILGIRSDLKFDKSTNPLNIVKLDKKSITVVNKDALDLLYKVYSKLNNYKIQKYESIFIDSENDLKSRYRDAINGINTAVNERVKIYWDLYNIRVDKFILVSIMATIAAVMSDINDIENLSQSSIDKICQKIFNTFKKLLRYMGFRSLTSIKKEISNIIYSIKNEDYSVYLEKEADYDEESVAKYRTESASDLKSRIEEISRLAVVSPIKEISRNSNLTNLLKSYYMICFAEDNMLKCECCGQETFITQAGEPYVEFHHLIPLKIAYGPDHYLNLFALCPNCHRKFHHLPIKDKEVIYINLNENNYLHLSFIERLRILKEQNLLKSYHLEFLLADKAITQADYEDIAA